VLDYTIYMKVSGGTFAVLVSGNTQTSYVATGLTTGTYYYFVVKARNVNGLSDDSNEIEVLAA
jgi:hypothetical protein